MTGDLFAVTSAPAIFAVPPIVTIDGVNATVNYASSTVPDPPLGPVHQRSYPTGAYIRNASPISIAIGSGHHSIRRRLGSSPVRSAPSTLG